MLQIGQPPVRPRPADLPDPRLIGSAAIAFLLGYLIVPMLLNWLIPAGSCWRGCTAAAPFLSIVVLLVLLRRSCGSWGAVLDILSLAKAPQGRFLLTALPMALAISIAAGIITLAYNEAASALGIKFGVPPTLSVVKNGDTLQLISFAAAALLAAPLFEEILFRKAIFESAEVFAVKPLAAVISAAAFAAVHLSLLQLPGLMFIALLWQYIFIKNRNLWTTVLLHFCNNFLALSMLLLVRYLNWSI